jgi:hypothetical protein
MKNNRIRAGYLLTVSSWENDYDNYRTILKDGLSKEKCQLFFRIALMCTGDLGNIYDPSDEQLAAFRKESFKLLKEFPEAIKVCESLDWDKESTASMESVACDYVHEILYDLVGGGEFYTRYVDSLKVHYIPEDIILKDVTNEFK